MLELIDISLKYPSSNDWALKKINFSGKLGEMIIFAGPSGSGKSSIAQMITGIIPLFLNAEIQGNIKINNLDVSQFNRKTLIEEIGYLPQYPADFTISLLVEEEVVFPLENIGLSKKDITKRLEKIFVELRIENLRNRLITELSSGELQRVALATILGIRPNIIVLDEPMARIDSLTEVILSNLLRNLADQGHLILIFEHRLDNLISLADKIIILDKGEITFEGKPRASLVFLDGVDIPEISLIDASIIFPTPLNLEEAVNSFRKKS